MKNKVLPVIAVIVVAVALLVVVFVPKSGDNAASTAAGTTAAAKTTEAASEAKEAIETEAEVNENGDIIINLSDLEADTATFISYDLNGTEIGLIAVRDDEGNISAAFNTCQVCNGSPKAYFVQKNGKLVCQNCGNKFSLSSVGASAMGCNPISISGDDVTETDLGILISREFLEANINLFNNWKKS